MNRKSRLIALRNFLILAAVASLGLVWQEGLGAGATALNQLFLVLFLAAVVLIGYNYFRENKLKWLVIKPVLRGVIVVCLGAIAFLVVAGPYLLKDALSTGGIWALVAVLGLIVVWIVQQSRKY